MTFWLWLRQQRDRDDPIGDLATDALHDRHAPHGARAFERYLLIHASSGARDACRQALAAWRGAR
jgi:hypothetical protein